MSPNVSNFVHDLVEMAQATQRLPELQGELDQARNELSAAQDAIAQREVSILKLKEEINALHDSLRSAEVARDHAETMFLEADDRADKALAFVRNLRGNIEGLLTAFEPVVPMPPEPEAAPAPVALQSPEQVPAGGVADPNPTQAYPSTDGSIPTTTPSVSETGSVSASDSSGQSDPLPTVSASPSVESSYVTGSGPLGSAQAVSVGTQAEGQREVNPTTAPTTSSPGIQTAASSANDVGNGSTEARPTSPAYGGDTSVGSDAMPVRETAHSSSPDPFRYTGKLYMRVAGWVSRSDWLSGGGSNETYDWREGQPLPEGVA